MGPLVCLEVLEVLERKVGEKPLMFFGFSKCKTSLMRHNVLAGLPGSPGLDGLNGLGGPKGIPGTPGKDFVTPACCFHVVTAVLRAANAF